MNSKKLENKIKKATINKKYDEAKFILIKCYIKHFKKMLKYKKIKEDNTWHFYDYIINLKKSYGLLFTKDLEELMDILYSEKYTVKQQISWMLENCYIFNDYKG